MEDLDIKSKIFIFLVYSKIFMDAVILCAGKGKRFPKPKLMTGLQKCMIEVERKPLIHHTLEHFDSVGINTVYFVIGYGGAKVREYFSKVETKNTQVK